MPDLGEAEGRRGRPGEPVTCGLALRKCEPDGFRNTGPGSVAARLRRTAPIARPPRTASLNTTPVPRLPFAVAVPFPIPHSPAHAKRAHVPIPAVRISPSCIAARDVLQFNSSGAERWPSG